MKKVVSYIVGSLLTIGVANADYRAVFMSQNNPLSQTKTSKIQNIKFDGVTIKQSDDEETKEMKVAAVDSLVFVNDTIFIEYKNGSVVVKSDLQNFGFSTTVNGESVSLKQDTTLFDFKDVVIDVKGETSNGSLSIQQGKRIKLRMNGLSITNPNGSAINIEGGKSVTVELVDGTINNLTEAKTDSSSAVFYSKGQLIFEGLGSLNVKGNLSHGIASKDYVQINSGNITVSSKNDAIHANDYFVMNGGSLKITDHKGDGIDAGDSIVVRGGELVVDVPSDDAKGLKSDGDITIESDAKVTINVTGDGSKGIKAGTSEENVAGNVYVKGGLLNISLLGIEKFVNGVDESSPSAIKADGNVDVTGGVVTIMSNADCKAVKGISADGAVYLHGTSSVDINMLAEKGKVWCVKASQIYVKAGCAKVSITPDNSKVESGESGTYSPASQPIDE